MRCLFSFGFVSSVVVVMPVAVQAAKIIAKEDNIKPETGKVAKQVKGAAADLGMMTISLSDYLTQEIMV